MKKKLGIIILNWNGLELLRNLLPGNAINCISEESDLIVADNGSTDGSVDWIRNNCPDVKIIELNDNYGFAKGYNLAIEKSDYPYIVLLNSDVETTTGWWQPMLAAMQNDSTIGAMQPKIKSFYHRDTFEYAGGAGGYLDALGYPYCRGRLFDKLEKDYGQYDDGISDIVWASGACLMTRRDLYLGLGGLDAMFFAHMEEIDLCCRILNAKKRVCSFSGSTVYHIGGASLNQGNPRKTYLNFRNNLLLLHKNLPKNGGKRLLFIRRLCDSLAFAMYAAKLDFPNARAILKAHRDFKKMRKYYDSFPETEILSTLPGANHYAVIERYFFGRSKIKV